MFGKILIFVHLGLSLVFATWAMVLFTTHVTWTEKPQPGQPESDVVVRKADYERLAKFDVRPADARFREAREKLDKEETGRPAERAWYDLQLKFLESRATEASPARQIDRGPNGGPIVIPTPPAGADLLQMGPLKDKDGQVMKNRDGQPLVLKSLDFYTTEYNTLVTQEGAAFKRRSDAAKRDTEATEKLKDQPNGTLGLHSRVRTEVEKQERVKDEHDEVRPLWLNTAVELKNLEDLRTRLEQRLDELYKLKSKGDKLGR